MTEEEKELWRNVHYRMNEEGFHYCFHSYSKWDEIKDEKFQELKNEYLKSVEALKKYIEAKEQEAQ